MFKYSFIIPSYKSEDDIVTCLKSISNLNFNKSRYETIVVDDGPDKVLYKKMIRFNFPNIKIYKNQSIGAASARNFGVSKSNNEILVFIDQDVVVDINLLNIYENAFKANNVDIVQGNIWAQVSKRRLAEKHSLWRKTVFIDKVGVGNNFINTIITRNVAIKKTVLIEIKKLYGYVFNETQGGTGDEDRELGNRIYKHEYKIQLEPLSIVKHRDPDNLLGILKQKYNHAKADYLLGINERFNDFENFYRVVINPIKNGVPFYLSFLIWISHIYGSESQRLRSVFTRKHHPRSFQNNN